MVNALLLAAYLFVQGAVPSQNSTYKVSGAVVREDNQDPARATNGDRILLRGNGPATVLEVGAGGAFEFTNVQPGTFQIVVGPMVIMEPLTVVVTDKDVTGLRVVIPDVVALRGTVSVDDGGPLPRFQLTFTRIDGLPGDAPVNVAIGPTFTAQLHRGRHRITASGLPRGYSLKSVNVGKVDVLTQPLNLVSENSESITVTLGVLSPPPWVKVSGRISAASRTTPITGIRISGTNAAELLTTTVSSDGSFEFSRVLPGSYSALALPATAVSSPVAFTVGTTDVTNLEIRVPEPKEINGRILVSGNVPMPRIVFSLAAGGAVPATGTANIPANPQQDGSFRIAMPQGELQITLVPGSIPPGYALTAFTYGAIDLLKNPLRVAASENAELRVTFDTTRVTPVNVSGRVNGLLTTQGVRVVLMSPIFGSVEAPVNPDGSFAFAKIVSGNYTARLSLSGFSAARSISVGNRDVTDVIINYPREFVVTGHTIVEGDSGAAPQVVLEARDAKSGAGVTRTSNIVNSGVIMLNLKDGEYNVSVRSVPSGYQLKSIMYGTTDLQKAPLKIDGPVIWEIIVRLIRL